jgi:predicted nucleic acid-binding protein
LVIPLPVIGETSYLIESRLGPEAESQFLSSFVNSETTIDHLLLTDLDRMAELVHTYADLPLGMVDASVVAVAERLGHVEIATLDRRVRPHHVDAFVLLP